ncbi:FixH family protein [Nonomuraea typhae]|uniref:FixH family protein n=1 Tax=Nonomuraea typhae TaxID=2603600 RepID=UPI0012FBDC69|nr:FixH family protein [Nonomuraea typhae]
MTFRRGFLYGTAAGLTAALAIALIAFLVTDPAPAASAGRQATRPPAAQPAGAGLPVGIDVKARHRGGLKVTVTARASTKTYDPLSRASVVMYADMVAMPMAHRLGPIPMTEVAGKPGHYTAETQVPMVGEYDIQVSVQRPLPGEAHTRVEVGAG